MSNVTIEHYDGNAEQWNEFVNESRNATFMHNRDYMEYHSDRFEDYSLLIQYKGELLGLLPANKEGDTVVSHGGLTFGGILTKRKMKVQKMLEVFEELKSFLANESVNTLRYKCIPSVYHRTPSQEDRYALFRTNSELYRRDVTSVVDLENPLPYQETRRRKVADAETAGLEVRQSTDLASYWDMLKLNLAEKHDTAPVHTLKEIKYLRGQFPENVKLYGSFEDDNMVGGVLVYESEMVARAQYIASNDRGREIGAIDIVFDRLLQEVYDEKRYFDFGISTEEKGSVLNEGLVFFKEGFGARSIVHDFYEVPVNG